MFRVLFVGVGGTGSILLPQLVRLLEFNLNEPCFITVYDGDRVEDSNLTRQLFSTSDIGKNKAQTIVRSLSSSLPTLVKLNAVPSYINEKSLENYLAYLTVSDFLLVVNCVDNDSTRKLVIDQLETFKHSFLMITPGNGTDRGQVLTWGKASGREIGVNPKESWENIRNPEDEIPRVGHCTNNYDNIPQLISANSMAATCTLSNIQAMFEGFIMSEIYFECFPPRVHSSDKFFLNEVEVL